MLLRLSGALHLQAHNQHTWLFIAIRKEERGKGEEEEEVFQ